MQRLLLHRYEEKLGQPPQIAQRRRSCQGQEFVFERAALAAHVYETRPRGFDGVTRALCRTGMTLPLKTRVT